MRTHLVLATVLLSLLASRCPTTDASPTQIQALPASEAEKDDVGSHVITLSPVNTAVVAGGRTSFSCISNSAPALAWVQIDVKLGIDNIIVLGCVLNPDYADDFELENIGLGRCDLVVKSASLSDALLYRCMQTSGFDPHQSALLAVLEAEPHCSIDNLDPHVNDNVTLTCDVSYTDNISPMLMTWTDEQGRVVPSSSVTNRAGRTTSITSIVTFTVTSYGSQPRYTCTTNFSAPVGLPSTATNAPALSFNWTSPELTAKAQLLAPLNTAGVVGQSVTLTCRRNTPDVLWNFVPAHTNFPLTIVLGCEVVPAMRDMFGVDTRNESCNLVIDRLTLAHAGTYNCQDAVTSDRPSSAQLIVLESAPAVTPDSSRCPSQLVCTIGYAGNLAPVVHWTDAEGKAFSYDTDTSSTRVESRLNTTMIYTLERITTWTYFNVPIWDLPAYVDIATNSPDYSVDVKTYKPTSSIDTLEDCGDIKKACPDAQSGIYALRTRWPSLIDGMSVYCDMDTEGGGWLVVQRRQDGSVLFYKDQSTYAQGFRGVDRAIGEFWIGNYDLWALTNNLNQYVLRVDLGDWSNNRRWAQYNNFKVLSSSYKFQLSSLGNYSGDAGDSLSYHLGMTFSAYNEDNDAWADGNCAVESRGGWWYNSCHHSNLNGEYNNTQPGKGVNWDAWHGSDYSLKFTEMKIRPANY